MMKVKKVKKARLQFRLSTSEIRDLLHFLHLRSLNHFNCGYTNECGERAFDRLVRCMTEAEDRGRMKLEIYRDDSYSELKKK